MSHSESPDSKPVIPFPVAKKEVRGRLHFGEFTLDLRQHALYRGQSRLHLTSKPFETLAVLIENRGQTVSKQVLMDTAWKDLFVTDDVLVKAVGEVRRVLEDDRGSPKFIQTVHGEGYRFIGEVTPETPSLVGSRGDAKPVSLKPVMPEETDKPDEGAASPQQENASIPLPPHALDWPEMRKPRARLSIFLASSALLALSALAGWYLRRSQSAEFNPSGRSLRLILSTEERAFEADLSPDAKYVTYVGEEKGQFDLFVWTIATGQRVRLTQDDAREGDPDFSPDGTQIVYARRRPGGELPEVCVIHREGGTPEVVISEAVMPAWSWDGKNLVFILRHAREPDGLAVAKSDGSDVRLLLRGDGGWPYLRNPSWSPDGSQVIVVRSSGGVAGQLWLIPTGPGEPHLVPGISADAAADEPVFTPDGRHLIYHSSQKGARNLWQASLSGDEPAIRLTTGAGPDESPSLGNDETIVFVTSRWRNALFTYGLSSGKTERLLTHTPFIWAPAISPDRKEIVFSRGDTDGSWHLWSVPIEGGQSQQLTFTQEGEIYPRFSRDGEWVIYCNWSHPRRIWKVPRAGGPPEPITPVRSQDDAYGDISPDGRWLAFTRTDGDITRLYKIPFLGGESQRLVSISSALPRWSPDGRWLAFGADRSVSGGIFIAAADGSNARRLSERGGWPVWWPDSSQIGYLDASPDGRQQVRVVSIQGGPPKILDGLKFYGTNAPFDVSVDGKLIATSDSFHLTDEIWVLGPPR